MFVSGIIAMWYGSIVSIPAGWVLCDGDNGTPDLRDKFVVAAGDLYAVDEEGGQRFHTHDFTGDGHTHTLASGGQVAGGAGYSVQTDSKEVTGITETGISLPEFHALAYIMKI